MRRVRTVVVMALVVGGSTLFGGPAQAKGPKPVISGLVAMPAAVSSDGATTVTASVSGATECELSSNKAVTGLPAKFSCEAGTVERDLVMPVDTRTKPAAYKLALTATGAGGKAKAKVVVTVEPLAPANPVLGLSAGEATSCAVRSGDVVDCWGNVLGMPGTSDTPVEVPELSAVTGISSGQDHTCALLLNGHLDCWGEGGSGQLGNGTTVGSVSPVAVQDINEAAEVSAGTRHTCAVLSSGQVDCWGAGESGQLGDGTTNKSDTPVKVMSVSHAVAVTAGDEDACALLSNHEIDCWGADGEGELGNGTTKETQDKPVKVKGISDAIGVSAGFEHTCALLAGGHVDCWGDDEFGQLGNGSTELDSEVPVEVQDISNATEVSGGREFTCARLSSGHVDCWGDNREGELGNGTTEGTDTPVEVPGITEATIVIAGRAHTCAQLASGHIDCWGNNDRGQLGNGTEEPSDSPVEVQGL